MQDKKYYVVFLKTNEKKLYFQSKKLVKHQRGMSEILGIFTTNFNKAKKFRDLYMAQYIMLAFAPCEILEVNIISVKGVLK